MRLFERCIRRAGIPIKMSQGFNPRPRMSFPSALALGIEGLDEIVELELTQWIAPKLVSERLKAQLPCGLEITSAEPIPPREPSRVEEVVYLFPLDKLQGITQERIQALLGNQELWVVRQRHEKRRRLNLRPSIASLSLGKDRLELRLKGIPEGMARPEEVLRALGCDINGTMNITRSQVRLSPSQGGN